MGIDQNLLIAIGIRLMPGQMDFPDQITGDRINIIAGVKAQITGRNVNVVYINQKPAARTPRGFGDKINFGDRILRQRQIGRRIFNQDFPSRCRLHLVNRLDQLIKRYLRHRCRQKVGHIKPVMT